MLRHPILPDFDVRFLEFARRKPANETYKDFNTTECALAQFVRQELGADHTTHKYYFVGADRWWYSETAMTAALGMTRNTPNYVNYIERTGGFTWGGVVRRLEALLMAESGSS